MSTKSQSEILEAISLIKKRIYVNSTELQMFLQYLDQTVFKRGVFFCGPARVNETPEFMRAFNTLDQIEKADYYLCCLKIVSELMKKVQLNTIFQEKEKYDIVFRLNKVKQWKPTTIVINFEEKTLYLESPGETLRLKNFIIRYSKCKDRGAFVLESSYGKSNVQSVRISHSSHITHSLIQAKIREIILLALKQKLANMLSSTKKVTNLKSKLSRQESITVTVASCEERASLKDLIKSSQIEISPQDYAAIATKLVNKSLINNLQNFRKYEQVEHNSFVHIEKSRIKKIFEINHRTTKQTIAEKLFAIDYFKLWRPCVQRISLLADITAEKSKIFHEIDKYSNSYECDYVYIRHQFSQDEKIYLIDKSISTVEYGSADLYKSRGNINHCIWRISEPTQGKIVVLVQCQLSHIECDDLSSIAFQHIGNITRIFGQVVRSDQNIPPFIPPNTMQFEDNGLEVISYADEGMFSSYEGISPKNKDSKELSQFYSICQNENSGLIKEKEEQIWGFETNSESHELKTRNQISSEYYYQINPQETKEKRFKKYKNERFFDDSQCIVNQNGYVVFVNQEKIKAQSSVLKNVLKKIGTNLFSGKSVLNISLPIQIFATDTNLQRICKANAYAPLFLENLQQADPLKRMISTIAYSMGNILLYIQMAKPFNPVLGETYQGFIDGCPIYGEQISHHPPISTIYFVGRGYFIHANLEAKVEFGLNSASGINQGIYKVAFHDSDPYKNVISFNGPPGELSGVVYGVRQLTLNSKTRYFDEQNQLFCEITWGKNKNQKEGNFYDYLEGKIVRLAKYQSQFIKIKTSKQDKTIGIIHGRWTEKIYFNDEVIFDGNNQHPYEVIDEENPLKSDGCFRADKQFVTQKKLKQAQTSKERIQQQQRNDRKLRKKYSLK